MSQAAATPVATPPPPRASENSKDDHSSDDVRASINVLRGILMLDTPARNMINASVSSPPPPTPQNNETNAPSIIQQQQLDDEIARRKTLQATYDNLLKFQKQQSIQLEILRTSRQDMEQQLAKKDAELKVEKEARFQDRMQWKPKLDLLQDDNKRLQQAVEEAKRQHQQEVERNSTEAMQEVERLKGQLAEKDKQLQLKDEQYQVAMQAQQNQADATETRLNQELARSMERVSVHCGCCSSCCFVWFAPRSCIAFFKKLQLTAANDSLAFAQAKLSEAEQVSKEKDDLQQQVQALEAQNAESNKEVCEITPRVINVCSHETLTFLLFDCQFASTVCTFSSKTSPNNLDF